MAAPVSTALLLITAVLGGCGSGQSPARTETADRADPGGQPLDVPLTRETTEEVAEACRQSVEPGTRPTVCPTLIPRVSMTAHARLFGPIAPRNSHGFSLMSFNNGFVKRHFILGVGSPQWIRRWAFDDSRNETGGPPRPIKDVVFDGTRVRLFSFSGGPNAGHVGALVDRPDGLEAFASMHGGRYTDEVVILAVDLARQPPPPH